MRLPYLLMAASAVVCLSNALCAESPTEIYQRRVIPLIQSSKTSSCSECHLQGVRLDDFLTSDPKTTFASLRARGWIDIDNPSESKLLQFIAKRPEKTDELIERVRQSELEVIGEWIRLSVKDPDSLNSPLPKLDDLEIDESLIRHTRSDAVLSRFVDIVWSQLERCANCHSPDRNAKQVEKHGERMSWIIPNSPSDTLQHLEDRKLINLEQPSTSLLRTKALGQDDHGGGIKFPADGQTDREWLLFLEDYAAIKNQRYTNQRELPEFHLIRTWRTGLHLRIKELPALNDGEYAVVYLVRNPRTGLREEEIVAIGEGRVANQGTTWGSSLMLVEPIALRHTDAPVAWDELLTEGPYQLRWLVVSATKPSLEEILAMPPTHCVDLESLWKPGHGSAKTISFHTFQPILPAK